MNLPPSALKGIKDMVRGMLPYEVDYIPKTKQSIIVMDIFVMIVKQDNSFAEWEGFTMYTLKKIDKSTILKNHVDQIINNILPVLEGYIHEK